MRVQKEVTLVVVITLEIMLIRTMKDIKRKKNVVILGGSIIEHANGWDIVAKSKKCNLTVKIFSGLKVRYLRDHVKPLVRKNLGHFILHIGINDLNPHKSR